jgi:hypothetical protein
MDWLFRPIGNFFKWTFGIIEGLGMNFNRVAIAIGACLIIYWLIQMYKQRKNDKGLFRRSN